MWKCILWVLPCLFVSAGYAQTANYTQAERFTSSKTGHLVGTTRVSPHFFKNSDTFWYSFKTGEGEFYYYVDPKAKVHRELFNREWMARELSKETRLALNSRELKLSMSLSKENDKVLTFKVDTFNFEYNVHTQKLVKLDSVPKPKEPEKKDRPEIGSFSPDSTYIVYSRDHNLFVWHRKDSVETQLTKDGVSGYSYRGMGGMRGGGDNRDRNTRNNQNREGQRGAQENRRDTNRREGVNITWFANSQSFYAVRSDNRKVKNLYVINSLTNPRPSLNQYPYVMAGDEAVTQYELSIFHADTQEEIKVPVQKWPDQTFRVLSSGKSSDTHKKGLYFMRKRRTNDELEICKVDTRTGEVTVLINEVSRPYLNNEFHHISIFEDDIIFWSERTGRGHLYHYDGNGNLKNQMTGGEWTVGKVLKVDTLGRTIYFEGYGQTPGECPYFARVNKVSFDSPGVSYMLTPEMATHAASFSESGRYFVDNYSRADLEPRCVLRDNKGNVVMELMRPDLTRLYATGWKMPEPFTVKAADGITDLYGYMWKPFDFDSTRRYPIISYVYPGPQTEAIPLVFSPSAVYNTPLAQLGFIVVTFGHRGGSPMRDKWYHTFGYNNLRDYPLIDDKYGIEQLADRHAFINKGKVGIFGHSGGGFMSTAAICTYPDFYTAAVSSAGNHDNNIYNQWWGETHHGVKETQRDVKKTEKDTVTGRDTTITVKESKFESKIPTNIELAGRLKGHLMLVTGDADNNVHPGNTFRMADALIKAGKNFDLVVLPGVAHSFGGVYGEFYQRKMWYHFAKYLLDDFSSERFNEIDQYNRLAQ